MEPRWNVLEEGGGHHALLPKIQDVRTSVIVPSARPQPASCRWQRPAVTHPRFPVPSPAVDLQLPIPVSSIVGLSLGPRWMTVFPYRLFIRAIRQDQTRNIKVACHVKMSPTTTVVERQDTTTAYF